VQVTAQQLMVRPLKLLGWPLEGLGEVAVDIPTRLQTPAEWLTTYLDPDVRVARSTGGPLFLFRRV
jgi:hypothetical protein